MPFDRITRLLAVQLVMLAACKRSAPPPPERPEPVVAAATIEGEVDATTGALAIRSLAIQPGGALAALEELPVVQDGVPGSGPPNTIELVTERAATVTGGCGAVDGFEGDIRVRSFYAGYQLRNVYVEILSVTPTGREACNSAPAVPGLSAQYGLFAYADLAEAGSPGDSAVATWRFRLPDSTRFVFIGRVMADIVDATAPTTLATPAGGTFTTAQTVTLTCTDLGSGCAATYYTTDGAEPTSSSTRYTAPLPIVASTTLRFFSVDAAGNAEAPRTETYVVDGVAPTVVSVSPYDGQGDVAVSTAVTIEFSEPMDAASVQAALGLTGPSGTVAGTAAPAGGNRWTFTLAAALDPGTRYAVGISTGARDLAGNHLAAAFSSSFLTTTPALILSGAGSATYGKPAIAQDASGNKLALFSAATQAGAKVLWSYYDASAGTWTAEQPILTYWTPVQPMFTLESKVVSNGTTFLAAWQNPADGALESAIFTNGQPGPVKKHWSLRYATAPTFVLAANGAAYAVVGDDSFTGHVYSAVHDGVSWVYTTGSVDNLAGTSDFPSIAPYGTNSFIAALRYGGTAIYTSRYDPASRAWTSTLLPGATGSATMLAPAIAAAGTRACVAWGATTGPVQVSLSLSSTTFAAATNLTQGYGEPATWLSAAANGNRFAVVWNRYGATYELFATWKWTPPMGLTGQTGPVISSAVVPAGGGFVAATRIRESTDSTTPAHAWVTPDTVGNGFLSDRSTLAESWPMDVADLASSGRANAPALLAWARDDGTAQRIETTSYDGSTLGPQRQVSLPGVGGSAGHVRLARNTAGVVLAVWEQDHRGALAVFAAFRRSGAWEAPVLVALRARMPEVASNGQGFMVVYQAIPTGSDSIPTAIEYAGGAWGAPTVLANPAYNHAVASDGTTYAAVWRYSDQSIRAAIKGTAGWMPNVVVGSGAGNSSPAIAALPGEYVVAYRYVSSQSAIRAVKATVTSPIGAWSWGSVSNVAYYYSSSDITSGPTLAAGPAGYAVAWGDSWAANVSLLTGSAWGTPTAVVSQGNCALPTLAAGAGGWLAAFRCGDLRLATWSAGAWGPAARPGITPTELTAAAGDLGYKLLARVNTSPGSAIEQVDVTGGTIHPPAVLSVDPAASTSPSSSAMAVNHDGVDWVAAWPQQGPDPITNRVMARTGF
jgi:hypothetical protein